MTTPGKKRLFEHELRVLINKMSMEHEFGDVPDFILAAHAVQSLELFGGMCHNVRQWHGDIDREDTEGHDMSDVEADADTLRSAGMGTDEDYGGTDERL